MIGPSSRQSLAAGRNLLLQTGKISSGATFVELKETPEITAEMDIKPELCLFREARYAAMIARV